MKFSSEQELAAKVVEWLHEHGWETWQEVRVGGGSCADIVARLGPVLWIIECKQSMSIAVMQQAYQWIGMANRVSVATPVGSRTRPDACQSASVGCL